MVLTAVGEGKMVNNDSAGGIGGGEGGGDIWIETERAAELW